eukprot:7494496-Alexandrium_andersonii.AAC.1
MSASLVGSEMCIRDRAMHEGYNRTPLPKEPLEKELTLYQGRHGCKQAVSYTHLTLPTICSV